MGDVATNEDVTTDGRCRQRSQKTFGRWQEGGDDECGDPVAKRLPLRIIPFHEEIGDKVSWIQPCTIKRR